MKAKCFYQGFYLGSITCPTDDGRFQARVAIMALDSGRTRSQRFLELETFETAALAEERAIAGGKQWIDVQISQDRLRLPTNFAPIG